MKYNVIHNFKGIKNVDFDLFQFSVYIMLCKREMEICFHLNIFFFPFSSMSHIPVFVNAEFYGHACW